MYTQLTSDNYGQALESAAQGILLCSKALCPHCKNMEKVMEKFQAKFPDVPLFKVDIVEEPEAAAALGADRVPTIMVIKGGKVATTKVGLMNPRELVALYEKSQG